MCIYSREQFEKKVAERDIEVTKVLLSRFNKLISPFMIQERFRKASKINLEDIDLEWKIGEVKIVELGNPQIVEVEKEEDLKCYYTTTSGLYSYLIPPTKKIFMNLGEKNYEYKKFKAIIPAGSEYYTNRIQYCSSALKIIEEICV